MGSGRESFLLSKHRIHLLKNIGFLSFGHWTPSSQSQTRSAADVLLQSIDLAVEAERLGMNGAYFRVHHFARQLASPFPLLAAVAARTQKIEIGTGVIDMRYENPHYMGEEAGAFRAAWLEARHTRAPRVSVSRSIFALTNDLDRSYFGRGGQQSDTIGFIDSSNRAVFGRGYAAEPNVLIEQLRKDEAIAAADTLLLTVPNQLGVA